MTYLSIIYFLIDNNLIYILSELQMWDNIDFFMIQPNHFDEVINHLKHNFFYDEPLNRAVGLCREKGQSNPELEKHSLTTVSIYLM